MSARDRTSTEQGVPATMPVAVFMGLREVVVEERPTPAPGPGELLLEVSHCGICGSDLHFLLEWGGRSGAIEGHEFSGTVVAVGDGIDGWQIGDRAVGGPSPKCGRCEYCLAHRTSLCIERAAQGRVRANGRARSPDTRRSARPRRSEYRTSCR